MGHQAVAYVTKILNTNEAISAESGRRKRCWRRWSSTASRATRLKSIVNDAGGQIRARLIALGNVLFDKRMSVRRDAALHDLWSPVASTAEARIVPARAAAYGRVTESIDLIAAYPQVVLGGNIKQALHHNTRLLDTRDAPGRERHCSTNCDVECASAEVLCTVSPKLVEISS